MRSKRPTIKDVAARAGVSRQTVSRVINDKPEVSPETRARVLAVIQELGYRPSATARSMVTGHTHTLGCITPNLTDFTFASMTESAQAEARHQGYFFLTGSAPTESDVEPLLEELLRRGVDGLLVVNPYADGRHRHLLPLIEKGMAVVYLGNSSRGELVSSVRSNERECGRRATRHLLDLGHTAIATITGPSNEECTPSRLEGYSQALRQAGLAFDPALVPSTTRSVFLLTLVVGRPPCFFTSVLMLWRECPSMLPVTTIILLARIPVLVSCFCGPGIFSPAAMRSSISV